MSARPAAPHAPHAPHAPLAPRLAAWPLFALGALLLLTVAAVAVSRWSDRAAGPAPIAARGAALPTVLAYTFHDRPDGAIDVRRVPDATLVHTVPAQSNGFLRGTLRGMARERKRRGIGPERPVHLVVHADGRLWLDDPATGWRADLKAFGPTNAAAFAPLLPPR
jgi:putative photosynthetic complex assembly protein